MKNEGLVYGLRTAAAWLLGIGAVVAVYMLVVMSKPGPFSSKGKLEPLEMAIAFGYFVYHACGSALLLGVAQVLFELTKLAQRQSVRIVPETATATTKCPGCGATYEEDLSGQFCEKCGRQL